MLRSIQRVRLDAIKNQRKWLSLLSAEQWFTVDTDQNENTEIKTAFFILELWSLF